ncbi:MAG: helix-turn-helix transcriptional regulator [Acidimicrobiales bacterium]
MTGWTELTDVERRVAELVSRGLTNKETACQIFVSRHTVDSHLRQVFRKLGVSSRVDLARLVGEHYEALSGSASKRSLRAEVAVLEDIG